ncbi:synaptonemal complex protein 2 [Rhea pennata]|uniref:synaptonemal complex protein 2 n=1 Tax=Rhea pennata TaxID=8795 RepID=UPI002E269698
MAARNEMKLEKLIDEATRKKDFQLLEHFLQTKDCENLSHKCSKQFVNKLDKLLCRELDKQEVKNISTLLSSFQKCGKKISIAGEDGLPAMMKYGLVERMVNWFEKVKTVLILRGNEKNEVLTSLAEDFFDVLLIICDTSPEGKMQILEKFVLRACTLIADVRINIYVQQEVVRKLNLMLDNMPRDARKKIFSAKEILLVMSDMGRRILDAGDYDLQVAITEALCRMTSEKQRGELACQWFSMEFVSNAFKGIKDSEFETDCRKFLNQVNGMLGDNRRVFTYPCLSASLDKYELRIPLDENLEEFWIDFNVGSRSISFYVAADNADHQWETVIIPEEEVEEYSLEEKDSKKLLTISLKNPVSVGDQGGDVFFIYFDSILEIKDVTRKIYGVHKCKGFNKKQSTSVAKTTVHVVFDESGSQVLVPESQLSSCLEEKAEVEEKFSESKNQQLPGTLRSLNKKATKDICKDASSKIITSCKRKVSEASVIISGTTRFPTRNPLVSCTTSTPCKGRFKLPLPMISSAERANISVINETRKKNLHQEATGQICAEEVLEMLHETEHEASQKGTLDEELDIVPDSQPVMRCNKSLLPGLLEGSFDEIKTWKKRTCSVPETNITTCDKQKLNLSSGHTSHPARVSETSLNSDFTKYKDTKEEDTFFRKETANHKQSKMKSKSKEVKEATKLLISNISDRYKQKVDDKSKSRDSSGYNRSHLHKSHFSVYKGKVQNRNLKTTTFLNITAGHVVDDVYNFNFSGFDEPTIKLGVQELHVTELSVNTNPTKKGNPDENKTSAEKKREKETKNNRNKKHLFSDTDTDHRADESVTDISWLQESNRKSKPQLIDYSRSKNLGKSISTEKTGKFSEPACQMDSSKGENIKKKKIAKCKKQSSRTDEMIEHTTRPKRPRRAALAKNYKEPSSSESESERKSSACPSKKEKSKAWEHINGQNKNDSQRKELQNVISVEPKKRVTDYTHKTFTKSKDSANQKEVEMPSDESPVSLEAMRCAERISEGDFTQEHISSERSPGLQELTPEKLETLNFGKGISPSNLCPQKKNIEAIHLNRSPGAIVKKLTLENKSFSSVLTAASLFSLTPITTYKTLSEKHAEGSVTGTCDANEDSSLRNCSSEKLSAEGKQQDITKPVIKSKEDYLPPSPLSVSSGSKVQSWCEEPCGPIHESGPTIHTYHKRRYYSDIESNSDEVETNKEEKKKGDRTTKLLPRKLFKTDDDTTYRVSESMSTLSVNDLSVLDGEIWEPGCSTISICQKLQAEFTRKIQSRSRRMDHFTKQSLRAAHHHLATMSYQLHECRIRQLDKFHFAIIEELENFEKDSQSLKNMEKEFLNFTKKHAHTFSTYMKNEQQRIQILKTSFEENIHRTIDYEEHIFTSEMHLMKEDMKGLQEKLLKEMQEEELFNVRRGLQTLFLSEDRKF